MKIKQTRQVRFDELLKHVWDKRIVEMNFKSKKGVSVYVHSDGDVDVDEVRYISKDDLFTITEEVEITVETNLNIVTVTNDHASFSYENTSIYDLLSEESDSFKEYQVKFIYLQNEDGSIGDLIWSKERGMID